MRRTLVPLLALAIGTMACATEPAKSPAPVAGAVAAPSAPQVVSAIPLSEATVNLARVTYQDTLVVAEKDGSTLRVGLVMVDNGAHTDVAPRGKLYLTMFNQSEMAEQGSLHLVAEVNEVVSAKRVEAGLYEVIVKKYDFDHSLPGDDLEKTVKLSIDARTLSAEVRDLHGRNDFEYRHVDSPITVTAALEPIAR